MLGGARLCDRGRGPARGPALPNSFPWLSANTSVWPDKTQSRADQQTVTPMRWAAWQGSLRFRGHLGPPALPRSSL